MVILLLKKGNNYPFLLILQDGLCFMPDQKFKNDNYITCPKCSKLFSKLHYKHCSNCFACTGCEIYYCPYCDTCIEVIPRKTMPNTTNTEPNSNNINLDSLP
jgi:hypothetical protein